MTVELLQSLSLGAYLIAGVFFLISVALFFLLDVPKLYGDVSGRTAKKAIEAIRKHNESTGNKAYKPSAVNAERGKITEKMSRSGKVNPKTDGLPINVGTEKLKRANADSQSNETTVLQSAGNETTVLGTSSNETTVLASANNETTVLTGALPVVGSETTLLVNEEPNVVATSLEGAVTVDVEMSFAESTEIIE